MGKFCMVISIGNKKEHVIFIDKLNGNFFAAQNFRRFRSRKPQGAGHNRDLPRIHGRNAALSDQFICKDRKTVNLFKFFAEKRSRAKGGFRHGCAFLGKLKTRRIKDPMRR